MLGGVKFGEVSLSVSFPIDAESVDETCNKNKIRANKIKAMNTIFYSSITYFLISGF